MDEERVIAEFERGAGQKVVVRRTRFKGKDYLDLRQFFQGEDGAWHPTKKGVSLPWETRAALIEAPAEGGAIAPGVDGTIVNLYYADLAGAVRFWHESLGFPVTADQGWAVLLRLAQGSFLGLVDGARGHLRPQRASAVLVTLVVEDLLAWREQVERAGASGITGLERREDLGIERFFCQDPGSYALEFQRFLRPDDRRTFHGAGEGRQS